MSRVFNTDWYQKNYQYDQDSKSLAKSSTNLVACVLLDTKLGESMPNLFRGFVLLAKAYYAAFDKNTKRIVHVLMDKFLKKQLDYYDALCTKLEAKTL